MKCMYLVLCYTAGEELTAIIESSTARAAYSAARDWYRSGEASAFCFSIDKPKASPWAYFVSNDESTNPCVKRLFTDRDNCLRYMWLHNQEEEG